MISFQYQVVQTQLHNQYLRIIALDLLQVDQNQMQDALPYLSIVLNYIYKPTLYFYHQMKEQISDRDQYLFILKDREYESNQTISHQWKDARSHFYTHQLKQILQNASISSKVQTQLIKLFALARSYNGQLLINMNNFGALNQYREQIDEAKTLFQSMNQQFMRKQRQCLPIARIINLKLSSIKKVSIQYKPKIDQLFHYSISADQLFKVISTNKLITNFTLKGVQVQRFPSFIKSINQTYNCKQQSEQFGWIKTFNAKSVRLALSATVQFAVFQKKETFDLIDDLTFFRGLFAQLSHIKVKVKLGKQAQINKWCEILDNLWLCLKTVKQIRLQIEGFDSFCAKSVPIMRSRLFGGALSSFSQIVQLSFKGMCFEMENSNNYLGLEQIFQTLFINNSITSLQLLWCFGFPNLPKITTLQSIELQTVNFRKKTDFMGEITASNAHLKSIKCTSNNEEWSADQKLVNRLQNLSIDQCKIIYSNTKPQMPSSLKYLLIQQPSVEFIEDLPLLLHKLFNLTCLYLSETDCDHLLICAIPSPYLQKMAYIKNNKITNQGIQQIDSKWPNLNYLQLRNCMKLSCEMWSACEFKGMMEILVSKQLLGTGMKQMVLLKKRGIQVDHY